MKTERSKIRETFRKTVDERVPYYGEYMIKDDDGEWVFNEKYLETEYVEA